jgi:hypothetical protein
MVNPARYMIRASFSQQCMAYVPEGSKVVYEFKNGRRDEVMQRSRIRVVGGHVLEPGVS